MPRGRPRKNPPVTDDGLTEIKPSKENIDNNKTSIENKASIFLSGEYKGLTEAQYNKLPECDRCHKKIVTGERTINLTYLTSMAPWHREISLEKVCLCHDCCKKFNKLIDDWLIDNGKGVKKLFE